MTPMTDDLATQYKGKVLAVQNLPTLPSVMYEITTLMEDPNVSIEQIADTIGMDQVLSAKVLKMVNSPIYGFPGRISSVQHALVLLGFNVIKGVIISTSVFADATETMRDLWQHSMACSLAAAEVARVLKFKDPGEYAVAGLLHDIGKVVIAVQLPEVASEIKRVEEEQFLNTREAETEVLGFAHDRVNSWLSDHWRFPRSLREGISMHHTPLKADLYPEIAHVVHIGNFFAHLYGMDNGAKQIPYLFPQSLKTLGINHAMLMDIMDGVTEKIGEMQG